MPQQLYACITGLVLQAGKYIANDDYTFSTFFMGMFLRRVLKFLVIIIGSFLGAVFLVIQWMQARQYLQGVGADYAQPLAHIFY